MKKIVLGFFLFIFWFNKSQAQIPNNDFESWHNTVFGYQDPDSWGTSNWNNIIQIFKEGIDVHNGQYALLLDNQNASYLPYAYTYFKINQHPTFLNAFVKLDVDSVIDSVSININVYNNSIMSDSGLWIGTYSINTYAGIKIPITQSTLIIDSVAIRISGTNNSTKQHTTFLLDDLSLDFGNGILENGRNLDNISISPNPLTFSSTLHFTAQLNNAEVIIYDMLGKEMMRKRFSGNEMQIEKGNLESGVYFVKVRDEERQWVEKIVVE